MSIQLHDPVKPKRVVVLGSNGFVGSSCVKRFIKEKWDVLALSRHEINLLDADAAEKLSDFLRSDDVLVITSAKAPCKNTNLLDENIHMMAVICKVLEQRPVKRVLYVSSDAVYSDGEGSLTESSPTAPDSLHGVMHVAREKMLQSVVPQDQLMIVRPSLLYGKDDPHNGYGPNRFYRLAQSEKPITLFGQGEEQRDHVYIEDVSELIYLCVAHAASGLLNIATGEVISFYNIAQLVTQLVAPVEIVTTLRQGSMPHNGYRAFAIEICKKAFPEFLYTSIRAGLETVHAQQNQLEESQHV